MALELVSKFGVDNAWFAFLKVRGVDGQAQDEALTNAATNRFRERVERAQKAFDHLKESGSKDELDEFMYVYNVRGLIHILDV